MWKGKKSGNKAHKGKLATGKESRWKGGRTAPITREQGALGLASRARTDLSSTVELSVLETEQDLSALWKHCLVCCWGEGFSVG